MRPEAEDGARPVRQAERVMPRRDGRPSSPVPGYTELRVDSLSQVQVALDPYISVLALTADALGRQRGAAGEWRRRVRSGLSPRGARAVLPIVAPRYSVSPDIVTPHNPALEIPVGDQVAWLRSVPEDELLGDLDTSFDETPAHWQGALRRPRAWLDDYATAIDEAWRSVEPLWRWAQPLLEDEVRRVGTAAVRGGLGLILDGLHPGSQFDQGVLRIRDPEPARFDLRGRPLVLVPMLSGERALICNLGRPDAAWIGYPLPGLAELLQRSGLPRPAPFGRLGAVLGPMRARILVTAERPLTMSDLARRAGVAPSAVTYHCDRLAAAGLVRREKQSRQVWVSQTSLGADLIQLFAGEN